MSTTSFKLKEILNLVPKAGSTVTVQGDLAFNSTSGMVEIFNSGSAESIVTDLNTLSLSNKTIDAGSNTITNLVNSNISSSAAIDFSKLATLLSGNILVGNGSNVAASVAMSGDATLSNTGALTLGSNVVSLSKLAQISTQTFLGRTSASTGNVENLTATQATAILDSLVGDSGSGGTKGLAPAPGSGDAAANKFLKASGAWAVPGTLINAPALAGDGTNINAATTTGSGSSVVLSSGPTLTNPVVGTQTSGDSSTKAASTAFVATAVSNAIAGINAAVAVQAATTQASDTSGLTYNNGTAGVGATLTGTANTAITIDSYTLVLNDRLLVKNDTQSPSGAFNGIYSLTTVQSSGVAPVLTRTTDFNTTSLINNTGAIPVINGTANNTTQWVISSHVNTIGTDPLVFVEFTKNPADYLAKTSNLSDVASKATSFNNISPITSTGDLIIGNGTNSNTRLTKGSQYQTLQVGASTLAYDAVHLDQSAAVTGTLPTAKGGTGITSFGTGVATWLGTPSSANLASAITDETGSGALVFATSPSLTTPNIGYATVTAMQSAVSTLTDGATITADFSAASNFKVQLGGNRTLGIPSNLAAGQQGLINVFQDGTGSRTLSYAWPFQFPNGISPTLSTGKYVRDELAYFVDSYSTATVTMTIASPCVVTWTGHNLTSGQIIQLTTTGALPTGLSTGTSYWIKIIDTNTFNLCSSLANLQAGTTINTSGSQSGTHTATQATVSIYANLGMA